MVTKQEIMAVQTAFNNYAIEYHAVHTSSFLAANRDLKESVASENAKQALIQAGKKAGIDDAVIKGVIYSVRTQTTDDKSLNTTTATFKTTDGKQHEFGKHLRVKWDQIDIAEKAAKSAAEEAARRQAEEAKEAARKLAIENFAETTAIVGKGGIVNVASNSPAQEAARLEVAKSLEARFADLVEAEQIKFREAIKLKADEEFKLVSDEGKIINPALLTKALKHFQQEFIPGIVPDAKVGTATHQKLLGYEGVKSGIDTATVSYSVTQNVGDLGGKRNSYELLAREPAIDREIAAKAAILEAGKLMDKLGIAKPDGDDVAKVFKERVQEYQRSRGLKDDGIIGKKTSLAMAQDNLRLTVGDGKTVNVEEVKAAVTVATRARPRVVSPA